MTNFSLPVDSFSRYSASRSQVESPPAFLMNLRVSSAASGVGSAMRHVHLRLAAGFREQDRHAEQRGPIVVAAMVVDQFLVRLDFVIVRLVRVIDAVGAVHRVVPNFRRAAGPCYGS